MQTLSSLLWLLLWVIVLAGFMAVWAYADRHIENEQAELRRGNEHRRKTHKERLKELLLEMGVTPEVGENCVVIHEGRLISNGASAGYSGFFCEFTFDDDGKLTKYGCYE